MQIDSNFDEWECGYPITNNSTDEIGISDYDADAQESSSPEALKALLNFSINNRDLDKLESLIGSFNPFKILGIQDYEIRHSNVLSWLIDPNGQHGLGDILFKKILLEVLRDSNRFGTPLIKNVISANFADLKVLREWRGIDIICISGQNNLVFVVENKVGAEESGHQLNKYLDVVNKRYPDHNKVFVFLTMDGSKPKGSDFYIPFTHEQVHEIVRSAVDIRQDFMNQKVYDFIQQYLQIIEEKSMKSEEFIDICAKLYREHGNAIKMIMAYGKPKLPISYIREFHSHTNTESVHSQKDNVAVYYSFIPQSWKNIIPETNKYKSDRYLVFFYLNFSEYENHKIVLSLNIGHFPDPDERARLIHELSKAGTDNDGILNVRRSSKTNTTIYSKPILLKYGSSEDCDLDDYDTITSKLVETYNSDEVSQVFRIVDDVVQSFAFQDSIVL